MDHLYDPDTSLWLLNKLSRVRFQKKPLCNCHVSTSVRHPVSNVQYKRNSLMKEEALWRAMISFVQNNVCLGSFTYS